MNTNEKHVLVIYHSVEPGDAYLKDIARIGESLAKGGHNVEQLPVNGDIKLFLDKIHNISPKCVFNLCEEVNGNSWGEIYIAGLLELLKIPYTGSGPRGLAMALDKARSKDILRSNGINVPLYYVFNSPQQVEGKELKYPLIVKPIYEDGSYGIDSDAVVYNKEDLIRKINDIQSKFKEPAIAEEYIEGREFNVSLLGNGSSVRILPLAELDFSTMHKDLSKICSYKAKWNIESLEYKGTVPKCPVELSEDIKYYLEDISVRTYKVMKCKDYARVDIRFDEKGMPYVIDINPNPCIAIDSGFVRSAKVAGLDYDNLINTIVSICMQRNNGNGHRN